MKNLLCSIKKHKVVYFLLLSIIFSSLIILVTQNSILKVQIIFSAVLIFYLNKYLYIIVFKEWVDKNDRYTCTYIKRILW